MTHAAGNVRSSPALFASKVPEVTVWFWVIKILTTGMGESTSDTLVNFVDPVIAVAATFLVFIGAMALQYWSPRYNRWRYWAAVTMVSVFGTMVADVVHVILGIPYVVSTIFFAVVVGIVFSAWWKTENTLSIHSIITRRREAFYWAAVLATFALGTAAGDMAATTLGLGYFVSGLLFLAAFSVPASWFLVTRRYPVGSFWAAYVLTRPLGASFADWMGVSHQRGGLDWGTGPVSLALLLLIIIVVALTGKACRGSEPATEQSAEAA